MKFILYDIFLNIDVDEAYDAHASIDHKFILISTPGDNFRNMDGDKFLFDFYKDNTYKYHSKEEVNTRIRVFNNSDPHLFNEYYAHLSWFDYFKLAWNFKKLWIQQRDNVMWIVNLSVAISAILLSTYVTMQLSKPDKTQKIDLVEPIKINEQQIIDFNKAISTEKIYKLDSIQFNLLLDKVESNEPIQVILNKTQLNELLNSIRKLEELKTKEK